MCDCDESVNGPDPPFPPLPPTDFTTNNTSHESDGERQNLRTMSIINISQSTTSHKTKGINSS
jgi:hypothetical protein